MHLLIGLAFIMVFIGVVLFFGLKLEDLERITDKVLDRKPKNFRDMAVKKRSKIISHILYTQNMLKTIGQAGKTYTVIAISIILMVVGFTSGISIGNYFMAPVLAVSFAFIPFLYVRFQHVKYRELIVDELEVSLSTVSISYERNENILAAVEENLDNMHSPIKDVFESFVFTVRNINPNMEMAIEQMKGKIDHSVWKEWCDSLKRCIQNRELKHTLRPTVSKLTKIKIVTGDLKNILYEATLNFWVMLIVNCVLLVVGVYVVPSSLSSEIPKDLTNMLVAVNVAVMAYSAIKVSFETRDINFDI